jgi:type I restriction enzyme S subunit
MRFLDHADRRIRRYVRAKQKLIRLLEEQKRAIVHRAATHGLDPLVRLKPSGLVWLGQVPEHWDVRQIGHLAIVGNGSTPSRSNVAYWAGGTHPWLNSSSVNEGPITAAKQFVTDKALRECHLPRVLPGSVLVAITGQGKTRGTAAVLRVEATINQHLAYITPRRHGKIDPEFLRAFLIAGYQELRRMSDDAGGTKGALTCEDIRHFRVALPPIEEQERIVNWTRDVNAKREATIQSTAREIALLREYSARLISDVATGKLDVREAATGVPPEPEGPDPVGDDDFQPDAEEVSADFGPAAEPAEA